MMASATFQSLFGLLHKRDAVPGPSPIRLHPDALASLLTQLLIFEKARVSDIAAAFHGAATLDNDDLLDR